MCYNVYITNREEIKMKVILNGCEVDFDVCVNMMDDDLRENLHSEIAPCSEQEFLDAYCFIHRNTFDEDFVI